MNSLIIVKSKLTDKIFYFRFFASIKYPNCFWYTLTDESTGFELGKIIDFEPINITWEKIHEELQKNI